MRLRTSIVALLLVLFTVAWASAYTPVGYGIAPYPKFKAYKTGTSSPLVGGKLYTCIPGTVCTAPGSPNSVTTYTSAIGDASNTNPIILDARGEANVWLSNYTKLILLDANDVPIWTVDNVPPAGWTRPPSGATTINASSYPSLNLAVAAMADASITFIMDTSTNLTADLTIPPTFNIQYSVNGCIDLNNHTLTVTGAPLDNLFPVTWQVFCGSGNVTGLKEARPEWFGTGNTAIQTCLDNTAPCEFSGMYAATVPLTVSGSYKVLRGKDALSGIVFPAGFSSPGLTVTGTNFELHNLGLWKPMRGAIDETSSYALVNSSNTGLYDRLSTIHPSSSSTYQGWFFGAKLSEWVHTMSNSRLTAYSRALWLDQMNEFNSTNTGA